jgi:RNA polymerase sigma factor (sigma-70 family)
MTDDEFRGLLLAELPRLRRLSHRLTPPGVDAEDLAQDVLERAWRSRLEFRGVSVPSTWLHRIMVNRAADLARRGSRVGSEAVEDYLLVEIDDPAAVLARAEDEAELRGALSRLRPEDRTALVLFDGEGLTAAEVGEVCGVSAAAVHKRVQRARWRLARELSEPTTPPAACGLPSEACRNARHQASDYLDGRLDGPSEATVDRHLRHCTRCPPLVQALVGLRAALRSGAEARAPTELLRAVRAASEDR